MDQNAGLCPSSTWIVYCDGSAMPNPGLMGIGALIIGPDGKHHQLSQATHTRGCNNEAELRALIAALELLTTLGARSLHAYSDNSILVEQLAGTATPAKSIARLDAMFKQARALLGTFQQTRLQWIPRHRNGEADALARAALGMAPTASRWSKR